MGGVGAVTSTPCCRCCAGGNCIETERVIAAPPARFCCSLAAANAWNLGSAAKSAAAVACDDAKEVVLFTPALAATSMTLFPAVTGTKPAPVILPAPVPADDLLPAVFRVAVLRLLRLFAEYPLDTFSPCRIALARMEGAPSLNAWLVFFIASLMSTSVQSLSSLFAFIKNRPRGVMPWIASITLCEIRAFSCLFAAKLYARLFFATILR
mmetsp:Transcript_9072/g.13537  ORF Transcript_9072/g.13537 Transcript_9072/m.13537 type:complete len:210 (+) Transcript_9072:3857-4486(+)